MYTTYIRIIKSNQSTKIRTTHDVATSTNAAMMATPPASGNTYAFKHLGGVMRFIVKNVPAEANQFVFQAVGKKIYGSFEVKDEVISTSTETSNEDNVTINFTIDTPQDMTFYVPMPVGEYGNYKVTIKGSNIGDASHFSEDVTNTIARKTLLLMPTFTYTEGSLTKGEMMDGVIDLSDGTQNAVISGNGDVLVVPGDDADATATLQFTQTDGSSTLAISDGSAEGTASGDSEGKVVVVTENGATVASCDIYAPTLSVTLSAADDGTATYNQVTATTANQTLIIGNGVTVNELIINGGNVIIEEGATVTTITNNAADNTITRKVNSAEGLMNAIEQALTGNTTVVEVVCDITDWTEANTLAISDGKNVVLDLKGNTISQEKECTASYEMIANNGTLTIKGNGKISFKDTSAGDPSFGWGSYTIRNNGNLTIENGTIEHLGQQEFATHMICAVFQYSGSTTINDGIISTPNYRSARLWHGEMTIEGGTFDGQLWVQTQKGDPATLTIEGGTFGPNGGDGSSVFIGNNNNTVNLSVTGGTFETKIGCSDATQDGVKGKVSGGIFTQAAMDGTNSNLIADNYNFVENSDGTYSVKENLNNAE